MNTRKGQLGVFWGPRPRHGLGLTIDPTLLTAITEGASTAADIAVRVAAARQQRPKKGNKRKPKVEEEPEVQPKVEVATPAPAAAGGSTARWLIPAFAFLATIGIVVSVRRRGLHDSRS